MTATITSLKGFLLTRQWRDTSNGLTLEFWISSEQGPAHIVITGQQAVCFISREQQPSLPPRVMRKELDLVNFTNEPVDGLYSRSQRDHQHLRDRLTAAGVTLYESDIKPADRFLMERFITSGLSVQGHAIQRDGYLEFENPKVKREDFRPALTSLSLDIETSDLDGELFSIAVSGAGGEHVFMRGQGSPCDEFELHYVENEATLMQVAFAHIRQADPDVLVGWNVVGFDLDYLARHSRRKGVPFALGRGGQSAAVLAPRSANQPTVARIPGRVVLDGIDMLRAAFWPLETYDLDSVANKLLGRNKLISGGDKVAEIKRQFREDKLALARYNLEDCRLVNQIFDHASLLDFAVERATLTGLALDRLGGSVAAFDNLYLPRLHRRGRVAPDVSRHPGAASSPGGYVMDSEPGLYENVLVLDFKSLYPSIIRSFCIDPLGLIEPGENPIPGFLEATFARKNAILPELIGSLWSARDEAKKANDAPLSQAIKILMNSCYGVLGSEGCRFFDPRLASSITRRGHEIINLSRDVIQELGNKVIYGDTDSLFVLLGEGFTEESSQQRGNEIARDLNLWWKTRLQQEFGLKSFLEIEFETHFLRFFMPTMRGSNAGSKKRYAGSVSNKSGAMDVVIKGLESVRTDWTPLARRFQRELLARVFNGKDVEDFVLRMVSDMLAGKSDAELVYRKRLRRPLSEYRVNVPPHVQAARKLENPGRWVEYVITRHGPEPVTDTLPTPNYDHYLERQLAPAANGILQCLGLNFDELTAAQMRMF